MLIYLQPECTSESPVSLSNGLAPENSDTSTTQVLASVPLVRRASAHVQIYIAGRLHFTGKERDSESGNDYFEARYYSSAMGRFLMPDWSAKVEPVPYAKMDNPQTLNLYTYVRNNPLNNIDLDGHMDCSGANAHLVGCQYNADWNAQHGIVDTNIDDGSGLQQAEQQGQKNQPDQPSYSIEASHGDLQLTNSQGSTVGDYSYTTGMNGDEDPQDKGKGPLPSGKYTLNPKEISRAGFFRRFIDPRDWGDYRVPLHPEAGTNTYGRSGFFLHGGWKRLGSEGCVKVNDLNQDRLFQLLQHSSGPVEVTVR